MITHERRRAMLATALAIVAAGCSGSSSPAGEASARYTDPAGDAGALPDIHEIDVKSDRRGRISIRVNVVPSPATLCRSLLNVFIDADADPDTGNDLDNAGVEYVLGCNPETQRLEVDRWPSSAAAGSWVAARAPTARATGDQHGVTFSIDRSDLGDTDDFNFFVARGAGQSGFPDRAPGTGTFGYSLTRGGRSSAAAPSQARRPDKAGGTPPGSPTVLTLATHDYSDPWSTAFASAVTRLSDGSMHIDVKEGWRYYDIAAEQGTIADVRHGAVYLAAVGARAWDLVGVKSFRALVAPLLVDSFAAQRRVLESSLPDQMQAGVRPLGLVGIAVLPGELRRPLGVTRRLIAPKDYTGLRIGIRPGGVARATFRALGAAAAKGFPSTPTGLTGFDGAEVGVSTIVSNRYDLRARALTANVVLWPRATTLVMNAAAFDGLSDDQRDVLRRAGREVVAPLLLSFEHDEQEALETVCRAHRLPLVNVSRAQRAALRRAVQPVYDELDRDRATEQLISAIRTMRAGLAEPTPLRCETAAPAVPRSPLDGRWRVDVSDGELRAAGASRGDVERFHGGWTLEFGRGRWSARSSETGNVFRGTYLLRGDTLRMTFGSCTPSAVCTAGYVTDHEWSVYRNKLSFTRIPDQPALPVLVADAWSRAH